MKFHSIKNRFILIFLMGTMFLTFIASIGVYGTIMSREEAKRHYEDNNIMVSALSHLKEDMMETRNRLLNMMAEHDKENMPTHRLEMMAVDADIEADFDALLDSKLIGGGTGIGEKLLEARSVWLDFKKTRYEKLIPLIVAGKDREAKEVGSGIQQERYIRMTGHLNEAIQTADGYLEQRQKELEADGRSLVFGIILLTGSGFISGAVIFYAYSRDIINRIKSLEYASRRLSEGDLSTKVAVRGEDEIASLAEAFNNMAETIQEDIDIIQKNERDLQEKNAMLNEAMIEREQHSKVIEYETQRREEQNKRLVDMQAQLLASEKMASVGQLAAGVAHEINNPVGFVNGNISTLSAYIKDITSLNTIYEDAVAACREGKCEMVREMEEDIRRFREEKDMEFVYEDIFKLVEESLHGLERITSIVRDLRSFSHIGEAEAKEFDINKGLDSTINVAWNEIKYKAEVKKDYGNIPMVYCYPQQLNQVFMNIIVNAAHAIEDKNKFRVRSSEFGALPTPNPKANKGQGLIKIKTYHDGENVFVEISDNGCGIPEDKIGNIFDPFFTTKPVGKGTGLGLSLAYNFIKKHNGEIGVRSKVGEGTTFTIRLPVDASLEEMSS